MAFTNLVDQDDKIIRLWQEIEPVEIMLRLGHLRDRSGPFRRTGIYKIDSLQPGVPAETRSGLTSRYRVYVNGECVDSFALESDADTFVRKIKDAVNLAGSVPDGNLLKRCVDI